MIDRRPAAAALIKKSRRVGMTAFLGWISGVRLMLTIAIACKIQDRSFRLCWQGESASTATRAFARVIVASWHINRLQGGRDVDRATPSDAHTQNDESGRVKACQNAGAKPSYRGQAGNFLIVLSLTAFEPKRSFGGFHSTCLSWPNSVTSRAAISRSSTSRRQASRGTNLAYRELAARKVDIQLAAGNEPALRAARSADNCLHRARLRSG